MKTQTVTPASASDLFAIKRGDVLAVSTSVGPPKLRKVVAVGAVTFAVRPLRWYERAWRWLVAPLPWWLRVLCLVPLAILILRAVFS